MNGVFDGTHKETHMHTDMDPCIHTSSVDTPKSLSFQLISDIHLEFLDRVKNIDDLYSSWIHVCAPILILAGDIANLNAKHLLPFLQRVSRDFEHVFWIMGNHEYYHRFLTPGQLRTRYRKLCPSNVHILDMECYPLPEYGVCIIGTTLWSDIPTQYRPFVTYRISDYLHIHQDKQRTVTPDLVTKWHRECMEFIHNAVASTSQAGLRSVVVTHHAPSTMLTSAPQYTDPTTNCTFASDVDMPSNVGIWCCGHTHHNFDHTCGTTRLVSNQVGYHGEVTGIPYQPDKVYHLSS